MQGITGDRVGILSVNHGSGPKDFVCKLISHSPLTLPGPNMSRSRKRKRSVCPVEWTLQKWDHCNQVLHSAWCCTTLGLQAQKRTEWNLITACSSSSWSCLGRGDLMGVNTIKDLHTHLKITDCDTGSMAMLSSHLHGDLTSRISVQNWIRGRDHIVISHSGFSISDSQGRASPTVILAAQPPTPHPSPGSCLKKKKKKKQDMVPHQFLGYQHLKRLRRNGKAGNDEGALLNTP